MTQTQQTGGKVAQLTPEEWKQLVIVNVAQLQNYVQSVPGNTEAGVAGLTDQHLGLIDNHLARTRAFMRAWSLARLDVAQPQQAAQEQQPQESVAEASGPNGKEPKRKGGWPRGKPRKPAAQPEQAE